MEGSKPRSKHDKFQNRFFSIHQIRSLFWEVGVQESWECWIMVVRKFGTQENLMVFIIIYHCPMTKWPQNGGPFYPFLIFRTPNRIIISLFTSFITHIHAISYHSNCLHSFPFGSPPFRSPPRSPWTPRHWFGAHGLHERRCNLLLWGSSLASAKKMDPKTSLDSCFNDAIWVSYWWGYMRFLDFFVYKAMGLNWVGLIWTGRLEDVVKTPWVVGWRTNQARSVDQGWHSCGTTPNNQA